MSKKIDTIIEKLQGIKDTLDMHREERQEKYDNHSDNWYDSDKASTEEENISYLEEAVDFLGEAIESLESIE